MDMSALLAALETLVLERRHDKRFVRWGALPAWCLELPGTTVQAEGPLTLEEAFPFLETFMETAEGAWRRGGSTGVSSGFWTEVGTGGQDIHLEAYAVRAGEGEVLLITRNERLFEQTQLVLQRARELHLTYGALLREIEQKDILLHAIIDDVASPLRDILGVLSLLAEGAPREPEARWIRSALDAARRQKQLIADILGVFSAEREMPTRALVDAPDLAGIIRRVSDEIGPSAARRNVSIDVDVDDRPHPVVAEEHRLVRVIANLLENAIRRSPDGALVRLTLQMEGSWMTVGFSDRGAPVPIQHLARAFETLDPASERAVGGIGLGLRFCRISAERWGGGIGYEPSEDGGGCFWVRLQAAGANARAGVG